VGPPAGQLRLFYAIFGEVAAAAAALLERGVAHFDLKCDNCLLEPLPGKQKSAQGDDKRTPGGWQGVHYELAGQTAGAGHQPATARPCCCR
jgi:hypothetical protein